jgi:serine-type D-Ala-D-Ala endopeptidase (penicillin-binding protein 7)
MNEYAQTLKQKLEHVDRYVQHVETPEVDVLAVSSRKQSLFTVKNFLWFVGIMIISVSVVAFFTQVVLLAIDNTSDIDRGALVEKKEEPKTFFDEVYVRAGSNPFDIVEKSVEKPIEKPVDLGIPGISRIGYSESLGETVLSDNINKYSKNTLVIGGREGEIGAEGRTIGGGDNVVSQGKYTLAAKSVVPNLSSKGYLVADLETGEIIIEKNADTIYPLASVSKLMTSVVAREKMDMQTVAIVSRDASRAYGAQGGLALGEKIRLRDLLFPLLMESSNDAAEVFADQYGHAQFIEEMNKKAKALDMVDTYYGDPSGLDPQNTSTPKDLLKLARYIYTHDPEIYDMTRVKQFSIKGHIWYNRNGLLPLAGFVGGKNGYIDQSRQTTVSLFEVPLAKGGVRTVVIVVLRSDAKDSDVAKLLNYLKRSVRYEVE